MIPVKLTRLRRLVHIGGLVAGVANNHSDTGPRQPRVTSGGAAPTNCFGDCTAKKFLGRTRRQDPWGGSGTQPLGVDKCVEATAANKNEP